MTPATETKQRYSIRVTRGAEVIGEYRFNATEAGIEQLKANVKPEFAYDILSANGIIHAVSTKQVPFIDREYPIWNADEAAHMRRVDAMRTRLDEAETTIAVNG